jgi:tyrosyl-tRNA synthetase
MVKYFRLCTSLPVDEVDAIESDLDAGRSHPNLVKRRLAREIVSLYHGPGSSDAAEAAFDRVFKEHQAPQDVPEVVVEVATVMHLPALLKDLGLATTTSEGRRLIDGGGVRVDGEQVAPKVYDMPWESLRGRVVQAGKRHFARPVEGA